MTSPDRNTSGDSRKRPLDHDFDNMLSKKPNSASGDMILNLKLLVPNIAAGAIIGKGGETIAQVQKDTNARMKMSKAMDFYPGTTERVCLITGNVEAIVKIFNFVMEKIREKPDYNAKPEIDFDSKMPAERDKQVKILVTNNTAGMIIGRAGEFIKKMKEETGCYIQISQKAKDDSLAERCITIIGDPEQNEMACKMILTKIAADPQSGSLTNISYADVRGPVANISPTGSPFVLPPSVLPPPRGPSASAPPPFNPPQLPSMESLLNGLGLGFNLNFSRSGPSTPLNSLAPQIVTQIMHYIRTLLRDAGYSDHNIQEIIGCLYTLSTYGLFGVELAGSPSHLLEQRLQYCFDIDGGYRRAPPMMNGSMGSNNNSFGGKKPQPSMDNQNVTSVDMEVGENIIGAILGPGGRSISEIKRMSGAQVQISKKGEFAPGTRNRLVTITGTPNAIQSAKYMVEQTVKEEESKRLTYNN